MSKRSRNHDVGDGGNACQLAKLPATAETADSPTAIEAYANGFWGVQPSHQSTNWGWLRTQRHTGRDKVNVTTGRLSLTRHNRFIFFQNVAHPLFKSC